ncbi:hypothetical protein OG21DRAFT_1399226, partial [Imleria badia]
LRSGAGTHNGREGGPILPRGLQPVEGRCENEGDKTAEEADVSTGIWDIEDDETTTYAMHAGISEAKGLEPRTIDEAQQWPDWLQWDEAINAELKSLANAHTWDVVHCP